MKKYLKYLEMKGYTVIDADEALVTKDGAFYKAFHSETAYWLVMEASDFYCQKGDTVRLINQFEFILKKALKEVVL